MATSGSTQIAQLRPGKPGVPEKHHKAVGKIKPKADPAKAEKPKHEGGPGSGPHPSVGDAIDKHNDQVRKKLAASSVKPPKQESAKVRMGFRLRLREADVAPSSGSGSRFSVILIQEGLGNLGDCFFYSKQCLQSSVEIFEGVKCFADHPSAIEEQIQPERSTRDILGHFEGVTYVENSGRGSLQATLVLCEGPHFEWAKSLLTNALEYATKYPNGDFVGLSINAQGEAGEAPLDEFMASEDFPEPVLAKLQDALEQGVQEVRPVTVLKDAVSCDLVTEAGAGGKILAMMERNKKPMAKKKIPAKESKKEAKHESEAHEQEGSKHESEGDGSDGAGPAGAGPADDHADADQDAALFKKMIGQYLGDDHDADPEEALAMAKHAHEHFMKQGMESHEAYEAAGKHLQASAAIGKNMAQAKHESEAHEGESESESEAHHEGHEHEGDQEAPTPPPAPAKKKPGAAPGPKQEANVRNELIQARAEIATLRESVKSMSTERALERKIAELSEKYPESAIKGFREALGKPKSVEQIDQVAGIYFKAYDAADAADEQDEVFLTEKRGFRESQGPATSGGFGDCVA